MEEAKKVPKGKLCQVFISIVVSQTVSPIDLCFPLQPQQIVENWQSFY